LNELQELIEENTEIMQKTGYVDCMNDMLGIIARTCDRDIQLRIARLMSMKYKEYQKKVRM
jgi:hypothetical protein